MKEITVPHQFKWWAKMGYSARGIVYLVIGGLALLTAFGQGGETTDSKGAIVTILNQPFGNIMVILLIIGLVGYVIWRLIQAIKDTDGHGTSAKGLAVRGGLLGSSISHAILALWATYLLVNFSGGPSQSSSGGGLLGSQIGQVVLTIAGAIAIIVGCAHIFKGWTARFERYMDIPADKKNWARPICRFGLIARGVVWCIVGWFLIDSVLTTSKEDAQGMEAALTSLRDAGYGPWLLGAVAAGLFAFGLYSCIEAVYRRIDTSSTT